MKTTVSNYDFVEAFRQCDRLDNFSFEALDLLFAYFEEYEESTGAEIELDVIAICCDYVEDSVEGIADSYGLELPEDEDEDEHREAVKAYLEDHTQIVGETASGFVYQVF
jgi:division protein CdvB (Snf7/Vps24/ESCRT-III family)